MKKVYSYIRFSSAKQAKGHSLKRQTEYAEAYAEKHGLTLDKSLTMRDEGLSAFHGAHIERGAFGLFLKAIESGAVEPGSILIVESLDRVSRQEPIVAQGILSQIISAGVKVVTASDEQEYDREAIRKDPMKLVYSLIIHIRSHEETETRRKRTTKAYRDRVKSWTEKGGGKLISYGQFPSWLEPNKDRTGFILLKDQAEIIKQAASLYTSGLGYAFIADTLNKEEKLPRSGNQWTLKRVRQILTNPAIVGEHSVMLDGEKVTIPNYYPPVLTPEEFSRMKVEQNSRKGSRQRAKQPISLLTGQGVLFCGTCGNAVVAHNYSSRVEKHEGARRLRCNGYIQSRKRCWSVATISVVPMERAILEFCSDKMNLKEVFHTEDTKKGVFKELSKARLELSQIEKNIESKAAAFLEMDSIPPAFVKAVNELEARKTDIAAKVGTLEAAHEATQQRPDIERQWLNIKGSALDVTNSDARATARRLIKATFERIELTVEGSGWKKTATLKVKFTTGAERELYIKMTTGEAIFTHDREPAPWIWQPVKPIKPAKQ